MNHQDIDFKARRAGYARIKPASLLPQELVDRLRQLAQWGGHVPDAELAARIDAAVVDYARKHDTRYWHFDQLQSCALNVSLFENGEAEEKPRKRRGRPTAADKTAQVDAEFSAAEADELRQLMAAKAK